MTDFGEHISKRRLAQHTAFWVTWVGGFTVLQSFGQSINYYGDWLIYYLVTLPLFMGHTYLLAYGLIPALFFKRRYFLFSAGVLALLIAASVGELLISNKLVWPLVRPEFIPEGNYLSLANILINGLGNEYIVLVFLSIKVVKFWDLKVGEKTDLTNKKLSIEIELLQSQSYPRFLLNVMDRLEKLAAEHSPQTSEMIIRLSNLMNSMNSGKKSAPVLLQKEIEMIRSYIDIRRMSFQKECCINLLVTGEPNGIQIPPLLFFQVVEEGFAVLGDCPDDNDFTILIKTEPHYLLFSQTLWNENLLQQPFNPEVMENCRKYLDYFYPENHKVVSNFEVNFAEVIIEIYS